MYLALFLGASLFAAFWQNFNLSKDYRTADRSSSGIAPDPSTTPEAVVQLYGARAFNWRGVFSLHTWVATKEPGASHFTVYQVTGWRVRQRLPALSVSNDIPDRKWFDARPRVLAELRGEQAAQAIHDIARAAEEYPYAEDYTLWPGPNSNTFTAYVARRVPELGAEIPVTAIGKDYLGSPFVGRAPSGSGFQISLYGILGLIVAPQEGLEVNLLGLSFGIDPLGPAISLPFIGRLGFSLDRRRQADGSAPSAAPRR